MSNERKAGVRLTWPSRAGGNGVARAPRLRRPRVMARVGLAVAALLATGLASTSQAATLDATLRGHLLSIGDLPAGWSVAPVTSTKVQVTTSSCGQALVAVLDPAGVMSALGLAKSPLGPTYETASFVEGAGLPTLSEALASGAQAEEAWQQFGATLAACRAATFVYKGTKVTATGAPLAFTQLGRSSSPYAWTIREAGAQPGPTSTSSCSGRLTITGTFPTWTWRPCRSPP